MKTALFAVLLASSSSLFASAAPLMVKRQNTASTNDIKILNFALTLENLEATFYQAALSKFGEADFRRANIPSPTQAFQNFQHIAAQEAAHVTTLQQVITSLGGTPVPSCQFQFPGVNTVQDFVRLAAVLEKVGVSAYNGQVALIQNPDVKTAAASIDTVEARHASFINTVLGNDPFSATFDVPLDARQVLTLASPLIQSCPFDLGITPFATLAVAPGQDILLPGGNVQVVFQAPTNTQQQLFCNFLSSDLSIVMPLANGNTCQIPAGARGDALLMVTNSPQPVNVKSTDSIVAGPVAMYVDTAHADSTTGSTIDAGFAAAAGTSGLTAVSSTTTSTTSAPTATSTATTGSELTAASETPSIAALESEVATVQAANDAAAAAASVSATQNLVAPVAAAPVINLN